MFVKVCVTLIVVAGTLASPLAAKAHTCEGLFEVRSNADAARKRFIANEYRIHLRNITLNRDTLRDQFFAGPFSEAPKLAPETVHFIESASTREAVLPASRERISNDPYFRWLRANRKSENADPVDLFFSTFADPGPSHLSAKLSLIRVSKDLDPLLSSVNHMRAILLLYLNKAAIVIQHRALPVLENTEKPIGPEILNLEFLIANPGSYNSTLHDELLTTNDDLHFSY